MYQVLLIAVVVCVYLYTTHRYQQNKLNGYIYWPVFLLVLLALRYRYITGPATNQDEMQWLVSAASMRHSFADWCHYFSSYDISRLFTILPPVLLSPILDLNSVATAHILAAVFSWLFLFISFRTVTLLFSRDTAIISSGFFIAVLGLTSLGDFVAYNSEYPAICLLAVSLLLLVSFIKEPGCRTAKAAFLFGVTCSWIPFAKEQALLLALLVAFLGFYQLASMKQWRPAVALTAGGAIGPLVAFAPVIFSGNIGNFLAQVQLGVEYGKHGLDLHSPQPATAAARMLSAYFFNPDYLLPALITIAGIVVYLFHFRKTNRQDALAARIPVYYLLILIVAVYTIYMPGNFFGHYGLFLFVPMVFFISFTFSRLRHIARPTTALTALVVVHVAVGLCFGRGKAKNTEKQDEVHYLLERYSRPGDGLVTWGWDNSIYLRYRLRRASRYLYPDHAVADNQGSAIVKEWYMQDIAHFKPRLVLELVGKDRFYFKDTAFNINNRFPQLQQYLHQHYSLAGAGDNFKLYVRK